MDRMEDVTWKEFFHYITHDEDFGTGFIAGIMFTVMLICMLVGMYSGI